MKKVFLIFDEWNNDRNFAESELEVINRYFNVTVIYNKTGNEILPVSGNTRFIGYSRKIRISIIWYILKCLFDKVFYDEIRNLLFNNTETTISINKISEIIRFYINGEQFYSFLKRNNCICADEPVIYYTYWYFWKCFALTRHNYKFKNAKIITRAHEYDLFGVSIKSGYQPFKRYMDKNLDKIIFISEHGRQYYINKYAKENMSSKYLLYHLGTRNEFGLNPYEKKDGQLHLVSCSSVILRKRVDIIVDALSLIDDIDIRWTHFGNGNLMDEIKKNALEKLSPMRNIKYELKGYTANSIIKEFYHANSIDAFVTTSVSEGNPISVIEAMSFGIPIIAANICNMSNLIKGNGILISENPKPQELADAIYKLYYMDCNELKTMRQASRDIWEEEYVAETNDTAFVKEVLMNL